MNSFANALGKDFLKNKDTVRVRSFVLGGHTFKVRVPLTSEFEAMQIRMRQVDEEKVEQYYKDLTAEMPKVKEELPADTQVEITDNDVVIDGRSMREAARNKVIVENRITEMFKLLVPEEQGFDMQTITYPMIEELFPFPIQMQVMEEIANVVSPNYQESRGK